MSILSKDAILKSGALPEERVSLPEMGGEVIVRGLTGAQRDKFEGDSVVQKGKHRVTNYENMRARLVVLSCVDEDGKRIFSDSDVSAVGQLPATVLDRLFDVARKLSGMTEQDVDDLGKPSAADQPAS